jgi:hypothetical protein
VRTNIWTIIWLCVISFASSFVLQSLATAFRLPEAIGQIASYVVGIWIAVALIVVYLASARHKKISLDAALRIEPSLAVNYFLLWLLTTLLAILSFVLFIIPSFFVVPRLVLAPYYLIDKKLGPLDALKASWRESKGNVGKIWGIFGATLVFAILILVLVGIYFLIMYSAVYAILYLHILGHKADSRAETVAT